MLLNKNFKITLMKRRKCKKPKSNFMEDSFIFWNDPGHVIQIYFEVSLKIVSLENLSGN